MTITNIRRTLLLRPLVLALLLMVIYGLSAIGVRAIYSPPVTPPTPTLKAANDPPDTDSTKKEAANAKKEADAPTIPWSDYQTALEKERALLAAQVDRQERWLIGIGVFLVGLIAFLFGQTRRDVVAQMREDVTQRINAQVQETIDKAIREQLAEKLKSSVAAHIDSHFKQKAIRWLTTAETKQIAWARERLAQMGFANVKVGADLALDDARLAILSYSRKPDQDKDGKPTTQTDEAQLALLKKVTNELRQKYPELPLIIACPTGHLTKDELPFLDGLIYVAANFDSTVLTQVLTLIHR